MWSDPGPVSGAASAPLGSLAGASGCRRRLDVYFVQLIFLPTQLREAENALPALPSRHNGETEHSGEKRQGGLPLWESRAGEASS